jgi:hypothetical protein
VTDDKDEFTHAWKQGLPIVTSSDRCLFWKRSLYVCGRLRVSAVNFSFLRVLRGFIFSPCNPRVAVGNPCQKIVCVCLRLNIEGKISVGWVVGPYRVEFLSISRSSISTACSSRKIKKITRTSKIKTTATDKSIM